MYVVLTQDKLKEIKSILSELDTDSKIVLYIILIQDEYSSFIKESKKKHIDANRINEIIENGIINILEGIFNPESIILMLGSISSKVLFKYPKLASMITGAILENKKIVGLV